MENYFITTICYVIYSSWHERCIYKRNNRKETPQRRSETMKALSRTWERLFAAITFAEAGEFETARSIMREREQDQKRDTQIAWKSTRLSAPGATRR
jgi:hypothetical protein